MKFHEKLNEGGVAPEKKVENGHKNLEIDLSEKYDVATPSNRGGDKVFLPLRDHLLRVNEAKKTGTEIAMHQIAEILGNEHSLKMSKTDFEEYFSSGSFDISPTLKQKNIGDCYAIAAIHSMTTSPFFELMCRRSIERLPDGTWRVGLPLLGKKHAVVIITQEELLPEKNASFLKRKRGEVFPDRRVNLKHVEGKEGLQVLELAFIKAKFGKVSRLHAEEGFSGEVMSFYGGEFFKETYIESSQYDDKKNITFNKTLQDLPSRKKTLLDFVLNSFNPDTQMATVATKHVDTTTLLGRIIKKTAGFHLFQGKGIQKYFVTGHAYSVSRVNQHSQTITVVNPWDTSKPIEMTFEQFKGTFSDISLVEVDTDKFLDYISSHVK